MNKFLNPTKLKIVVFVISVFLNALVGFWLVTKAPESTAFIQLLAYLFLLEIFGLNVLTIAVLDVGRDSVLDAFPLFYSNYWGLLLIILNLMIVSFLHYILARAISKFFAQETHS